MRQVTITTMTLTLLTGLLMAVCGEPAVADSTGTSMVGPKKLIPAKWTVQVDNFGSKADTGSALVANGVVKVAFTMVKQPSANKWPYVELMCDVESPISESDTLEISYKSDTPLLVKLVQSDLSEKGNETYAYYEYELPASPKKYTATLVTISEFTQPSWAPEAALFVPLRPERVGNIQLAPAIETTTGGFSLVEVNKFVVYSGAK